MALRKYASVAFEGLLLQTWKAATQLIFGGLFIFLLSIVLIFLSGIYILGFSISSELSAQLLWWPLAELVEVLQFAITVSVVLSIGVLRIARDPPDFFFGKKSDILLGPLFLGLGLWLHKEFANLGLDAPAIYIDLADDPEVLDFIGVPSVSLFMLGAFTMSTGLILLGFSRSFLYISHLTLPDFSMPLFGVFRKAANATVSKFGQLRSLHNGIRDHSTDIEEGYFTTIWVVLRNNTGKGAERLRYIPRDHVNAEGVCLLASKSDNIDREIEDSVSDD